MPKQSRPGIASLPMIGRKQARGERRQRAANNTALSEGHSSSNFANFPLKISQKQSVSTHVEEK